MVEQWNNATISEELTHLGIKWKFNPPAAPHHGGAWERLVRSCKRSIYHILGSQRLTDEVLQTVLCMVEQSLNARPLLPASADIADLEALTPNHFLLGRPSVALPWTLATPADVCPRKAFLRAEAYANDIWTRWLREYVPTLNVRHKWRVPDRELATGDLVWLVDPSTPRGHYPMARILELRRGPDGVARSARIRLRYNELVRPVTKLAPVFEVLATESKNGAGDVTAAR